VSTYKQNVRRYLLANFRVDEATVDAALAEADVEAQLVKSEREKSYPYYPGGLIAEAKGWEGIPDDELPEDAYDGCPPDEDDDEDEL
jgi:hypothetical protein